MKNLLILVAALLLAGCDTTTPTVYTTVQAETPTVYPIPPKGPYMPDSVICDASGVWCWNVDPSGNLILPPHKNSKSK
jgi:hypothetical protein